MTLLGTAGIHPIRTTTPTIATGDTIVIASAASAIARSAEI